MVTHQLQVECKTGKVRWPKTDVLPLCHTTNQMCVCCVHVQIIDSIMALFRVDFSGRGELADRQQKLAQMLSRLQKISEGSSRTATIFSFFPINNIKLTPSTPTVPNCCCSKGPVPYLSLIHI